ncbi:MAG: hypothetical protein V3R66_02760, partial [Rhodospirillales bacterium]
NSQVKFPIKGKRAVLCTNLKPLQNKCPQTKALGQKPKETTECANLTDNSEKKPNEAITAARASLPFINNVKEQKNASHRGY